MNRFLLGQVSIHVLHAFIWMTFYWTWFNSITLNHFRNLNRKLENRIHAKQLEQYCLPLLSGYHLNPEQFSSNCVVVKRLICVVLVCTTVTFLPTWFQWVTFGISLICTAQFAIFHRLPAPQHFSPDGSCHWETYSLHSLQPDVIMATIGTCETTKSREKPG